MLAPKPQNEAARLAALREYEVLDTDPEVGFDDLTLLAASICEVPISLITLIDSDRQWFKSRVGLEVPETPLEHSMCAYAILQPQMLVVEDAARDANFATHPAVARPDGIRFYAGTPLITPEGFALGTLCVADRVPHRLLPEQRYALEALGRQVQTQLELRRMLRDLRRTAAQRDRAEAANALKTAEIERDLSFARQFQRSLLPSEAHYPVVPDSADVPLRLSFHHVYQPALSLGGDFFDVLKLSAASAGVLIADVMGHGARSALVTAILRTLFQEIALQTHAPDELLTRLNSRFYQMVQDSQQFLFASACYLLLDTEKAQMHYASAGHPAPLWANRARREVAFLSGENSAGAALGLTSETTYSCCSRSLCVGDLFVLFTDGLSEAPHAASGEEFGEERLAQLVKDNPDADGHRLARLVVEALNEWTGQTTLPDDLCLVIVEIEAQDV